MKENLKCVYVLEMNNNTVKIGVSKNVAARIKRIVYGSGLSVLNSFNSIMFEKNIALEIEKTLHEKFNAYRIKGEFFNISFSDACNELKNIALEYELKLNGIKIISDERFGDIRVVIIDTEIWFVGKDVAAALGYKNPERSIRNFVDTEDKGVTEMVTPGGKQNITIINESGLYSLILSSKLPKAKEFKRWVTSEVLPSIRKTGAYVPNKPAQKKEPAQKRVVEMDFADYLNLILKHNPNAEMVPAGLTQEYDEDGNLCTVFKVDFVDGEDDDD